MENVEKDSSPVFTIFPPAHLADVFGNEDEDSLEDDDDVLVVHNKVYVGDDARVRAESVGKSVLPPPTIQTPCSASSQANQQLEDDILGHLQPLEAPLGQRGVERVQHPGEGPARGQDRADGLLQSDDSHEREQLVQVRGSRLCPLCPHPLCFRHQRYALSLFPFTNETSSHHGATLRGSRIVALRARPLGHTSPFCDLLHSFRQRAEILPGMGMGGGREAILFQEIYSYLGFLMSLAWMYFIAAEVVDVVSMIGVVSRLSHEVTPLIFCSSGDQ